MKNTSWKYVVAACSACLLLFTASANAGVLTFDTLTLGGEGEGFIPNGYGGLQWDNFGALNVASVYGQTTGYFTDLKSKPNVAFNWSGEPASIFKSSPFVVLSANLAAAWTPGLEVTVVGYLHGKKVYNHVFTLSTTKSMPVHFNCVVDELDFSTSDSSQFAMDNLFVVP